MAPGGCTCSALNCKNTSNSSPKLSFFHFPRDEERGKKWLKACRRQDLLEKSYPALTKNNRLCSAHFEAHSFSNFQRNRLFDHAVPSIFNFSVQMKGLKRIGMKEEDSDLKKEMNDINEKNSLLSSSLCDNSNGQSLENERFVSTTPFFFISCGFHKNEIKSYFQEECENREC